MKYAKPFLTFLAGGLMLLLATASHADDATVSAAAAAPRKVVVYGSSVALGYGSEPNVYNRGSYTNGYAGLITALLTQNGWAVTNISIGGQVTSNGLARFEPELEPLHPGYVLVGYSLANEGFVGSKNPIELTNRFISNLAKLIPLCRSNDISPVLGLTYAHGGYSAKEYQYGKDVNLVLNSWDVPSINLLGALDDGSGHWAADYFHDAWHPNNAGYREMFYAFVPTLFDALSAGKTHSPHLDPVPNFARMTAAADITAPLTFTPGNAMHSFTMAFRVRSTHSGTIAAVRSDTGYATIALRDHQLIYVAPDGRELAIPIDATNGWHDVTLAARYAASRTMFAVDGAVVGYLPERYVPDEFVLGGPGGASQQAAAPAAADFKNWCLYRAAWNADEARAQAEGHLQQASMEICAPLSDATFSAGTPATNVAQSLSVVQVIGSNIQAMTE